MALSARQKSLFETLGRIAVAYARSAYDGETLRAAAYRRAFASIYNTYSSELRLGDIEFEGWSPPAQLQSDFNDSLATAMFVAVQQAAVAYGSSRGAAFNTRPVKDGSAGDWWYVNIRPLSSDAVVDTFLNEYYNAFKTTAVTNLESTVIGRATREVQAYPATIVKLPAVATRPESRIGLDPVHINAVAETPGLSGWQVAGLGAAVAVAVGVLYWGVKKKAFV